jgi:hypothetical protein
MASNRQSPLWNQDAIMAAGLAFAGMAVLQGTLLPETRLGAWRAAAIELLSHFVNWHVVEWWWPAMLIVVGIFVWWRSARQNRRRQAVGSEVPMGGLK